MVQIGKTAVLLAAAVLLLAPGTVVHASEAIAREEAGEQTLSPWEKAAVHADAIRQDLLRQDLLRQDLPIRADGTPYPGRVWLRDGSAWVSLREFAIFADGEAEVRWDGGSMTAYVRTSALSLSASAGERVIEANGRLLLCPDEVYIDGAMLWVPLRAAARAFGFACSYDPAVPEAALVREAEAIPRRDAEGEDALFWLSRIIEAEAGAEPFEGKLAVGSVILNRVLSDEFPDTIWGVIFDDRNGVQFTPAENGAIWHEPGTESVRAACVTLDNPPLWEDIEYFLNPAIARSLWIPASREFAFTIGGHDFYR